MAGLYIVLSLITAVLFLLTRKSKITLTKSDALIIRLDLTFFALELKNSKKIKKRKKKGSKKERARLFYRIKRLLGYCEVELCRLDLGVFDADSPEKVPLFYLFKTAPYALCALLASLSADFKIAEGALNPRAGCDPYFSLTLKAPLILLLYYILLIRIDKIRTEREKIYNVGNENG